MSDSDRNEGSPLALVVLGAVFAYLVLTVWFSTVSRYSIPDFAALSVLYLLLSVFLYLGSVRLSKHGVVSGFVASCAVGAIVVWHFHEQTQLPPSKQWLFVCTLLAALVYFVAIRSVSRVYQSKKLWLKLSVIAGCFAVALFSFWQSNTLRWHLLRHNKLIGTPAYYLFARPIGAVEGGLRAGSESRSTVTLDRTAIALRTPPQARPATNIVFVMVDTLRADSLEIYGGPADLMPHMNQVAEDSLIFTDVLANSSWTKPSVASMFTGLVPEQHGVLDWNDALSPEHETLAEILRTLGYRGAAFVTNLVAVNRDGGFDQGFEHFYEIGEENAAQGYARGEAVTEAVTDFLASPPLEERAGTGSVRFLYLHYLDPHKPYLSGGRDSFISATARHAYNEELRYLDEELGKLYRLLRSELAGPTFVLFTSDHGEELGDHNGDYRPHGHSLYSELVSIPVILTTPDATTGLINAQLEGRDIFELLLKLAASPNMNVSIWAGERSRQTRYVSSYLTGEFPLDRPYLRQVLTRGVERDGWFLIWSGYGETYELYDMFNDPGQRTNLARTEADRVEELSALMGAAVPYWYRAPSLDDSDDRLERLRSLGYIR